MLHFREVSKRQELLEMRGIICEELSCEKYYSLQEQ